MHRLVWLELHRAHFAAVVLDLSTHDELLIAIHCLLILSICLRVVVEGGCRLIALNHLRLFTLHLAHAKFVGRVYMLPQTISNLLLDRGVLLEIRARHVRSICRSFNKVHGFRSHMSFVVSTHVTTCDVTNFNDTVTLRSCHLTA